MIIDAGDLVVLEREGGKSHIIYEWRNDDHLEPICNLGVFSTDEGEIKEYDNYSDIPSLCQQCDRLGIVH